MGFLAFASLSDGISQEDGCFLLGFDLVIGADILFPFSSMINVVEDIPVKFSGHRPYGPSHRGYRCRSGRRGFSSYRPRDVPDHGTIAGPFYRSPDRGLRRPGDRYFQGVGDLLGRIDGRRGLPAFVLAGHDLGDATFSGQVTAIGGYGAALIRKSGRGYPEVYRQY